MDMYEALSAHYDEVFPLEPERTAFALGGTEGRPRVLDIGCATGSLALALAASGRSTTGIDLSSEMIGKARERAISELEPSARGGARFIMLDMLDIAREFGPGSFDAALCLGNTLVHLPSEDKMAAFFRTLRIVLSPGSPFLLQILNYDRILDGGIHELPVLETRNFRFERRYSSSETPKHLLFETKLILKSGESYSGEALLAPVRALTIERLLSESGFATTAFYGTWEKSTFSPKTSFMLVATAISA
jgi:glycine/sarcosine N-methyltransferase